MKKKWDITVRVPRKKVSNANMIASAERELAWREGSHTTNVISVLRKPTEKKSYETKGYRLYVKGHIFDISKDLLNMVASTSPEIVPNRSSRYNINLAKTVNGDYVTNLELCNVSGNRIKVHEAESYAEAEYICRCFQGVTDFSAFELKRIRKNNPVLEIAEPEISESRMESPLSHFPVLESGLESPLSHFPDSGKVESRNDLLGGGYFTHQELKLIETYLPYLEKLEYLTLLPSILESINKLQVPLVEVEPTVRAVASAPRRGVVKPESEPKKSNLNSKVDILDGKFIKMVLERTHLWLESGQYSKNKCYQRVVDEMYQEGSEFNELLLEFLEANPRLNGEFKDINVKSYYNITFTLDDNGEVVRRDRTISNNTIIGEVDK